MKQINLSYDVPISLVESSQLSESEIKEGMDDFTITGVAINAAITDNNHKFLSEELQASVSSLVNRPLLKDHNDSVDSIVGRVIKASYDEVSENIKFHARINNTEAGKRVKELIKAGDLNTVSVGAAVREMTEEDGVIVPRGIKFKELSLVATPADDNAQFTFRGNTLGLALKMAWSKSHESIETTESQSNTQNDLVVVNQLNTKIEEKKDMVETKIENETINPVEEKEVVESKALQSRLDALEATVKSQAEVISQVLASLSEVKTSLETAKKVEEVKAEVVVESPKAEEKTESPVVTETVKAVEAVKEEEAEDEEELEEDVEEKTPFKVLQTGNRAFTIVQNKYR